MASNYSTNYQHILNQKFQMMPPNVQNQIMNQIGLNAYPNDTMDLRERAIESMEDFLTLLNREKQRNNPIRRAIVTPEQANILLKDSRAVQQYGGSMIANRQPVAFTLYGVDIEVKR